MRRILALVGLAGVWALIGAAPAAATEAADDQPTHGDASTLSAARVLAGDSASSCPDSLTTSLTLTTDLECSLLVEAPNVTIDLAGHVLFGGIFADPAMNTSGLAIRNGTVDGSGTFETLIVNLSARTTLSRVEVRGAIGFAVQLGSNSTIDRSEFVDNEIGIDLFWGGNSKITRSTFEGNRWGIINGADRGTVIERNMFVNNDVGVFVWDEDLEGSSSVRLSNNKFRANRIGLDVMSVVEVDGLQVLANAFWNNSEAGIRVEVQCGAAGPCGLGGSVISGNKVFKNGFGGNAALNDGIAVTGTVDGRPNLTVTRNTATRNADLGIDAAEVTDGGANRAHGNNNPTQCVGVVCR